MNEASSRYVDQIATEKLVNEKLFRVHHAPDRSFDQVDLSFTDFYQLPALSHLEVKTENERIQVVSFPSSIQTIHLTNNQVWCRVYLARQPVHDMVFLHGLYEDNLDIYTYFFSLLIEQGINVYLMQLPYHYDRKPEGSLFSGEYFWSANIGRNAQAFKQAVYDAAQLYLFLSEKASKPVFVTGFSMGGGIGLKLAALYPLEGLFIINPVCNISKLTWESQLFSPIRSDLELNGIDYGEFKSRILPFEPLADQSIQTDRKRIVMATSLFDQINDTDNYDLLASAWKIPRVFQYNAGHLNIVRVPRLALDLVRFINGALEP